MTILIRETFRQGNVRHELVHMRESLYGGRIRDMFPVSVSDANVNEVSRALRDTGRAELGWSDYRVVTLSELMNFDHVIRVDVDARTITEPRDVRAPDAVYDDAHDGDESWSLMTGYTGQHGYNGPTLHPSEVIGGGLERDILSTSGYYVALVSYALDVDESDDDVAGWSVAFRPLT